MDEITGIDHVGVRDQDRNVIEFHQAA